MTPEDVKREKQLSKWKSVQNLLSSRKLSVGPESSSPTDLVESCGGSVSEDLDNLLREVSDHYKHLMKEDKAKGVEFRGPFHLLLLSFSFPLTICCLQCLGVLLWSIL
jgi:hypothetical protein